MADGAEDGLRAEDTLRGGGGPPPAPDRDHDGCRRLARRLISTATLIPLLVLVLAWPAPRGMAYAGADDPVPIPFAPIGPLLGERTRLTSNFAQPRSLRLHAGIDYSTNRERGMPVLAPAGGWISRIASDYTGYGLQLVISDSLGRRHLFAHLLRFRDDLQAELERTWQVRGAYVQLLEPVPGRFPVRAGEIIAWSGDTGNGPPHLHYELRAAGEDRCFNPLRHGLELPDDQPPLIESLALVPLETGGQARGRLLPQRVAPLAFGYGRYRVMDTLSCVGPLGLALHAVDRLPGTESRLAPWQIELVEEGDTLFRLRFDSFPLGWNDQSGRVFHRWLQQETGRPFLRLWGGGGRLGLWSGQLDEVGRSGRLVPDPARPLRRLELLVRDARENLSRLELVLRLLPVPPVLPGFAPLDSTERALLRDSAPRPTTKPKADKRKGRGRKGRRQRPAPPPPPAPPPAWTLFSLPDGLHLRLAPLPAGAAEIDHPRLTSGGDTLAAWGQLRAKGWEWALPASAWTDSDVSVAELPKAPILRLGGVWLEPDREQTWREASDTPAVVLYADPGTVAEPLLLLFRRWREPAGVFTLGPPDLQLERDLTLEISLAGMPEARRSMVALFEANARGQPVGLVGGERDGDRLRVPMGRMGAYVLHADTRGPTVKLRKPPAPVQKRRKRGRRSARPGGYPPQPSLIWEIGGDPSGIANVELREGGRRHYPPYEPDTHLVRFRPAEAWEAGERELELVVRDRSGNETGLTSTIRISSAMR